MFKKTPSLYLVNEKNLLKVIKLQYKQTKRHYFTTSHSSFITKYNPLSLLQQATRSELPWKRLGYNSVIELMCDMPDVVTFERPTQGGDWLLFDATLKEEIRKTQAGGYS